MYARMGHQIAQAEHEGIGSSRAAASTDSSPPFACWYETLHRKLL